MNIPIRVFNKVEVVCGSSMLWGVAGGGGTLSGNCYTDQTKIIIISIYGERAHQKWIVKSIIGIRFVPQRRAPHLLTAHQQQNTILPSIHPSIRPLLNIFRVVVLVVDRRLEEFRNNFLSKINSSPPPMESCGKGIRKVKIAFHSFPIRRLSRVGSVSCNILFTIVKQGWILLPYQL